MNIHMISYMQRCIPLFACTVAFVCLFALMGRRCSLLLVGQASLLKQRGACGRPDQKKRVMIKNAQKLTLRSSKGTSIRPLAPYCRHHHADRRSPTNRGVHEDYDK
jgi:hypothetical protein